MENILFGVAIGMLFGVFLFWISQKTAKPKEVVVNKLATDINDYDLPEPLPVLVPFNVLRSLEQTGDVLTVTWKYKDCKSFRAFVVDPDKSLADNKLAFEKFVQLQEMRFYIRNASSFPLRKGKKK